MSVNLDQVCTFLFELYEYKFGKGSFEKSVPNMIAEIANKNFNVFYKLITDCDQIAYMDEDFRLSITKLRESYYYIREEILEDGVRYIGKPQYGRWLQGRELIYDYNKGRVTLPGNNTLIYEYEIRDGNTFREYIINYWIKLREKYTIDEIMEFWSNDYYASAEKFKPYSLIDNDGNKYNLESPVFNIGCFGKNSINLNLVDLIRLECADDKFPKSYHVIDIVDYKNVLKFIKTIELSFNDICRWCYERKYGSIRSKIERLNTFELELNELKSEINSRVEEVEKAHSEEKAKLENELLEAKTRGEEIRIFAESQSLKLEELENELEKSKSSVNSLEVENSELREKLKSILSLKNELLK